MVEVDLSRELMAELEAYMEANPGDNFDDRTRRTTALIDARMRITILRQYLTALEQKYQLSSREFSLAKTAVQEAGHWMADAQAPRETPNDQPARRDPR